MPLEIITMDQVLEQQERAKHLVALGRGLFKELNSQKELKEQIECLSKIIIVLIHLEKELKKQNIALKLKVGEIDKENVPSTENTQKDNSTENFESHKEVIYKEANSFIKGFFKKQHSAEFIEKQRNELQGLLVAVNERYEVHKAENARLKLKYEPSSPEANEDYYSLLSNIHSAGENFSAEKISPNGGEHLYSPVKVGLESTFDAVATPSRLTRNIELSYRTPTSADKLGSDEIIDFIIETGLPIRSPFEDKDSDDVSTDSGRNSTTISVRSSSPSGNVVTPPPEPTVTPVDDDYSEYLHTLFSLKEEEVIKKDIIIPPAKNKNIPKPILPRDKTFSTPLPKKIPITPLKQVEPSWKGLTASPVSVTDVHSSPYFNRTGIVPFKSITAQNTNDIDEETDDLLLSKRASKSYMHHSPVSYVDRLNREHSTLTVGNNKDALNILLVGAMVLAMLSFPILALFAAAAIMTYSSINTAPKSVGVSKL